MNIPCLLNSYYLNLEYTENPSETGGGNGGARGTSRQGEPGGGRTGGGGGPRIDPKFVNNPELSDIQFRVEGTSPINIIHQN